MIRRDKCAVKLVHITSVMNAPEPEKRRAFCNLVKEANTILRRQYGAYP